jgi:HrpA-like RNA helicase
MISQPRRLAASSLMKRLRSSLGDLVCGTGVSISFSLLIHSLQVGLRMGFGVRDETDNTLIHFVTTGYLVWLFISFQLYHG